MPIPLRCCGLQEGGKNHSLTILSEIIECKAFVNADALATGLAPFLFGEEGVSGDWL